MNNKGLDFLKKIPSWFSGLIAFLSALIGFAILLRDNYHLGVLLIGLTLIVALFIGCVYLGFSRTAPLIHGGRGVFRFNRLRHLAFFGLTILPIIMIVILAVEPSRNFVVVAIVGTPKPSESLMTNAIRMEIRNPNIDELDERFLCNHPLIIPKSINIDTTSNENLYKSLDSILSLQKQINQNYSELTITSLSDNEWVKLENKIIVKVIAYKEYKELEDVLYNECDGQGGPGIIRNFPSFKLNPNLVGKESVLRIPTAQFFTLSPGEFEVFRIETVAEEPGYYEVNLGIEYNVMGQKVKKWASNPVYIIAPEKVKEWMIRKDGTLVEGNIKENTWLK